MAVFVESAGFLTGSITGKIWRCRLHFLALGTPSMVEFDWEAVVKRDARRGDVIGFYHTHPPHHIRPSGRDIMTMRAWCDCLGKPLVCAIGLPGLPGEEIFGYLFRNYRSRGRRLRLLKAGNGRMTFKEQRHERTIRA